MWLLKHEDKGSAQWDNIYPDQSLRCQGLKLTCAVKIK